MRIRRLLKGDGSRGLNGKRVFGFQSKQGTSACIQSLTGLLVIMENQFHLFIYILEPVEGVSGNSV